MPVAIETVIIVIVVISFVVLAAIVFALYWLWRLLLEDRRCSRLRTSLPQRDWSTVRMMEDGPQRALLNSRTRHERRQVIVDERSRRMASKAVTCSQRTAPEIQAPDVIVIDDTEPPPPYEAVN